MKKMANIWLALLMGVSLVGCQTRPTADSAIPEPASFAEAEQTAKGKTVSFYGFGGSEKANQWVDEVIAPKMKEKYDIKLKRVPMDINDILTKLLNEKEAQAETGDIDVIWINGENFYTAKQANLLYGPVTERVPNVEKLMAVDSHEFNYDFGVEIEGYEVPYGTAQLVFVGDQANFSKGFPKSAQALLAYAKENPGKLTYTAPPEFTGSAFVRNIICEVIGFEALNQAPAEKEALHQVIMPGLDYLNELKPFLWQKGATYPATTAELDQLFAANQVHLTYSYSQMHVAEKRQDQEFKESVESFVFDQGTITNQNYLAIAANSAAKDAAIVLINEMISEEAQLAKASAKYGFSIPPFEADKLSAESVLTLASLYDNQGVLSLEELQAKQLPEVAAEKISLIEELWKEYVLHE
ncbi:ABC transporter substrate-binding protein [Vagococcus sp. BWB3-3]|uniref:ABC transporter substrate-binding protein n=1 Tax=Vagococcus allomyrinae TaxID=2794353 RepID=A0A940SXB2_9ENTE|nr:ABC transporter substrate-binding protein [Vagococcus allomyrinae]MBP1042193.1 ABC transporter substrate-binding protein [Vagococcus allomyrinae]